MYKIATGCFLLLFCWLVPCVAAPLSDAQVLELCQYQSLGRIRSGVFALPETIMNDYFADVARDHPQVKEAHISVLADNRLRLMANVEGTGRLQLTCVIRELHYDKDRASLELYIEKKEIIGRPITSWLMNQVSWGFIADIFGNPLDKANVNSEVHGNRIDIDLKPFTAGLFRGDIAARLGEMLIVSQATTEPGVLYLHTNLGRGLFPWGL